MKLIKILGNSDPEEYVILGFTTTELHSLCALLVVLEAYHDGKGVDTSHLSSIIEEFQDITGANLRGN